MQDSPNLLAQHGLEEQQSHPARQGLPRHTKSPLLQGCCCQNSTGHHKEHPGVEAGLVQQVSDTWVEEVCAAGRQNGTKHSNTPLATRFAGSKLCQIPHCCFVMCAAKTSLVACCKCLLAHRLLLQDALAKRSACRLMLPRLA